MQLCVAPLVSFSLGFVNAGLALRLYWFSGTWAFQFAGCCAQGAVKLCKYILRSDPDNVHALSRLGIAKAKLGLHEVCSLLCTLNLSAPALANSS